MGAIEESADEAGGGIALARAARGLAAAPAAGAAGVAELCLAMSAKAFRMLEVSGAAADPLAGG